MTWIIVPYEEKKKRRRRRKRIIFLRLIVTSITPLPLT
jgi:hypothetical protein